MALNFIDIATEQTSAVTDLILALQALVGSYFIGRKSTNQAFATTLWSWVFGLLCFASLLGTVVHGFELTQETIRILWAPLYFALGLLVALVALAAISHGWGNDTGRRLVPVGIGIAFVFSATTQIWSDSFLLFVGYEAVMMTIALILYVICLWIPDKQRGAGFLAAGVFLSLIAAAVDSQTTWRPQFIWTFDSHGIFHLIQMMGLLMISIGLYRANEPLKEMGKSDATR